MPQKVGKASIISLLNFKCYLNNKDFDKVARNIQQIVVPSNIKLLISPPNIYLHKFTKSLADSNKYELCAQNLSTIQGFGAFTGEVTAEMLKDVGVNWCLVGHPEFDLTRDKQGHSEYTENAQKMINALEASITPILILSGSESTLRNHSNIIEKSLSTLENPRNCTRTDPSDVEIHYESTNCNGYENFNVESEVNTLIEKIDKYFAMLREYYPSKELHINVAYEPRKSIGSGIPMNPEIVQHIIQRLHFWCANISPHNVAISVLYGGSLSVKTAKEYVSAGCAGLLFGKCSVTADIQTLIDSLN